MKKLFVLLITAFLASNFESAQSSWLNYKIDGKLSTKLPSQPKTLNENSVYALDKDSLVYIVTVVDLKKVVKLDSAALVPLATTTDFANKIKEGVEQKMHGFAMGDIKIGKWKDYTSYKLTGENDVKQVNSYTLMIIVGSKLYALMTLTPENKTGRGKNSFYSSLKLN
jgi:ABC-type transporter Mla MlaB component